jgi:hypothetical protein
MKLGGSEGKALTHSCLMVTITKGSSTALHRGHHSLVQEALAQGHMPSNLTDITPGYYSL